MQALEILTILRTFGIFANFQVKPPPECAIARHLTPQRISIWSFQSLKMYGNFEATHHRNVRRIPGRAGFPSHPKSAYMGPPQADGDQTRALHGMRATAAPLLLLPLL
jgi:hypothetical protein